jgi:hypothetical protein
MKLRFLYPTSRTAINVHRLKRCGYDTSRIIDQDLSASTSQLIVLGNGSPEDKVIGILSYHLDGNNVIAIVKPTSTRLSVLDQLKTYLDLKFEKILLLVDQDDLNLNDLFDEAARRLGEIGVNAQERGDIEEIDRFRVYECALDNKRFEVIIVVSGLEEICASKHTIEDHLTKAAGIDITENSKDSWHAHMHSNPRDEEDVFRLLQNRDVVDVLFSQHISGCKCLENTSIAVGSNPTV